MPAIPAPKEWRQETQELRSPQLHTKFVASLRAGSRREGERHFKPLFLEIPQPCKQGRDPWASGPTSSGVPPCMGLQCPHPQARKVRTPVNGWKNTKQKAQSPGKKNRQPHGAKSGNQASVDFDPSPVSAQPG